MKTKISISKTIYCFLAIVMATSCSEELYTTLEDGTILTQSVAIFNLEDNEHSFEGSGGSRSNTLRTSFPWQTSGVPDWVTIDPASGRVAEEGEAAESVYFNTSVSSNDDILNSRIAIVNFATSPSSKYQLSQELTIEQNCGNPYIEFEGVSQNQIFIDASAQRLTVGINTNIPLSNLTASSGSLNVDISNGSLIIDVPDNQSKNVLYYGIIVKGTYEQSGFSHSCSATLWIMQDSGSFAYDTDEYSLTAEAQSFQISFTCSMQWKVECNADWLTFSPNSGNGGTANITVSATANPKTAARSAYVYISNVNGEELCQIFVTQEGSSGSGSLSDLTNVNARGASYHMSFSSTVAWRTLTEASWIEVVPESGDAGTTDVKINVLPNTSSVSRCQYLYFMTSYGYILFQMRIDQLGASIISDPNQIQFVAAGESKTISINSDVEWTANSDYDWISVSPASGGIGTTSVTITTTENPSDCARSANLTFGNKSVYSVSTSVSCSQAGTDFNTDENNLTLSWNAQDYTIPLQVSGNWYAAVSDNWITLDKYSGSGNDEITLSVTENTSDSKRTGSIDITSDGEILKISLTQKGQYLTIDTESTRFAQSGGSLTLSVGTTVGAVSHIVYIDTKTEWLSCTESEGTDNVIFTIVAGENPNCYSREAYFVIEPNEIYNSTSIREGIKVHITQEGRSIRLSQSKIAISGVGGESEKVFIDADGEYEVYRESDANWFSLINTDDGFYIVATTNTTGSARTGKVIIALCDLPTGQTYEVELIVEQSSRTFGFFIDDYGTDQNW